MMVLERKLGKQASCLFYSNILLYMIGIFVVGKWDAPDRYERW